MPFRDVALEAFAYELPDLCVTTDDLESSLAPLYERLRLQPGWIEGLTGVRERRLWPVEVRPWQMAARAGAAALEAAGVARSEVDVVVNTSVCRDVLEPSVASSVHGLLGLPATARNFDVVNACLGFLSGLSVVGAMIESGMARVGLVVAGEGSREVLEATLGRLGAPEADGPLFSANLATLTLGSAAVAAVVTSGRRAKTGHRLQGEVALADTAANDLCRGDMGGMTTDGGRLLEAGVSLGTRSWAAARQAFGWERPLAAYAMHQVGRTHYRTILKTLGIPAERSPEIYPTLGNVGAAGVPITLLSAVRQGLVREGDELALLGIGSGLNCAIQGVRW